MRTFEEIKKRKLQKKRKWGADLIALCQDKLQSNLTIEEIVEWLNAEPINLAINSNDFTQLKYRYFNNKIKAAPVESMEVSNKTAEMQTKQQPKKIVEQKHEDSKKQVVFKSEELKQKKGIVTEGF